MGFRDYAKLAIQVFEENKEYADAEGRHLFVTLSDIAIQKCDHFYAYLYNQEYLQSLLHCMEEAARVTLEQCIADCGYYGDLPWLASLSHATASNTGLTNCTPLSLLRTLEKCFSAGLLADGRTQKQLDALILLCACRNTVITDTPGPVAEGALCNRDRVPVKLEYGAVEGQIVAGETPLASSMSLPRPDDSCQTPLLVTPSSITLTEGILDCSVKSSDGTSRLPSPVRDD